MRVEYSYFFLGEQKWLEQTSRKGKRVIPPVRIKVAQALPKVVDPQLPPFTPR